MDVEFDPDVLDKLGCCCTGCDGMHEAEENPDKGRFCGCWKYEGQTLNKCHAIIRNECRRSIFVDGFGVLSNENILNMTAIDSSTMFNTSRILSGFFLSIDKSPAARFVCLRNASDRKSVV